MTNEELLGHLRKDILTFLIEVKVREEENIRIIYKKFDACVPDERELTKAMYYLTDTLDNIESHIRQIERCLKKNCLKDDAKNDQ